jgi:hypothetical protein
MSSTNRQRFVNDIKTNGIYSVLSRHIQLLDLAAREHDQLGMQVPVLGPRIPLVDYPQARLRNVYLMAPQDCAREDYIAGGAAFLGGIIAAAPGPWDAIGIFLGAYGGAWLLMRGVFCN